MEKYYCNFKNWDKKRNRYSVFGREKDGKLELFILKAGKKESFFKVWGRQIYERFLNGEVLQYFENGRIKDFHPKIVLVPIEDGDSPKWTFQNFCQKNFLHKKIIFIPKEILV